MNANKLSKRLSYIRSSSAAPAHKPSAGKKPVFSGVPPEWNRAGDYVFIREYRVPFSMPEKCRTAPLLGEDIIPEDCIFFDTETTGLSGGAGTIAFLIGTGRYSGGCLRVRQYFLADFPGEREMLKIFAEEFDNNAVYVSYNGKTFDSSLLRSRFICNGMEAEFSSQADLLYPVRRLWKSRLPSCSLSVVEREVLGIERTGDIPGREVPEYYFTFLRTRSFPVLEGVFRHNKQDIVSLAVLLLHFHTLCSDPLAPSSADPAALARVLLEHGDSRGLELLERESARGAAAAGTVLGLWYKRTGSVEKAVPVWKKIWEGQPLPRAGLELAKYYEHRVKDYAKALVYVNRLREVGGCARTGETSETALLYRRNRLVRKLRQAESAV